MPYTTPPTHAEIAKLAGVSQTTVSKVLNNYPRISAETREKVLSIAKSLGYRSNPALTALVNRRWKKGHHLDDILIGVVWFDGKFKNRGYLGTIYQSLAQQATELGYIAHLYDFSGKFPTQEMLERHFYKAKINCIVSFSAMDNVDIKIHWHNYYHLILFGHRRLLHLNQIRYDWMHSVDIAVKNAVDQGYKRIGFVSTETMNSLEERLLAASYSLNNQELTKAHGPQPQIFSFTLWKEPFFKKNYTDYTRQFWKQHDLYRWYLDTKPDVIIASDPQPFHMLKMAEVLFPKDCAYISLHEGDTSLDEHLTCVSMDPHGYGQLAANMIHYLIQTNQQGTLPLPLIQAHAGKWVQGETLPKCT